MEWKHLKLKIGKKWKNWKKWKKWKLEEGEEQKVVDGLMNEELVFG